MTSPTTARPTFDLLLLLLLAALLVTCCTCLPAAAREPSAAGVVEYQLHQRQERHERSPNDLLTKEEEWATVAEQEQDNENEKLTDTHLASRRSEFVPGDVDKRTQQQQAQRAVSPWKTLRESKRFQVGRRYHMASPRAGSKSDEDSTEAHQFKQARPCYWSLVSCY
jgi:hypothetical protein